MEARLDYGHNAPQVVVSGGWHHPQSYPFSMEFTLVCEDATLDFRSADRPLPLYRADGTTEPAALTEGDAFEAELAGFTAACASGQASEVCPPEESADAVAIASAADLSRSRSGETVSLRGKE
jgi:hypothetical protein